MDLNAYHNAINNGFSEREAEKIGEDAWEENEYQRMKYENSQQQIPHTRKVMTEIEIVTKTKIFDDPEYCNENDDNRCSQLKNQEYNPSKPFCPKFFKYLRDKITDKFDEWDYRIVKLIKCDECKEAWNQVDSLRRAGDLITKQKDLEPEISKIVDENFYDLLENP